MKRRILFLLAFTASTVFAQEPPRPAGRANILVRAASYVGHEAKRTVLDLKHPEWDLLVAVEVASYLADTKSTCDGFAHGFRESNSFYGHTRSCAKLSAIGAGYTFGRLTFIHTYRDEVINFCAQDENEPHPEGCGHSMWIVFSPTWIIRARQTWCNEELIDGGCRLVIKHPPSMVNRQ